MTGRVQDLKSDTVLCAVSPTVKQGKGKGKVKREEAMSTLEIRRPSLITHDYNRVRGETALTSMRFA